MYEKAEIEKQHIRKYQTNSHSPLPNSLDSAIISFPSAYIDLPY
jgi:hypothetical protein